MVPFKICSVPFWNVKLFYKAFNNFFTFLSKLNIVILKSVSDNSKPWRPSGTVFIVSLLLSLCNTNHLWLHAGHIQTFICRNSLRPRMMIYYARESFGLFLWGSWGNYNLESFWSTLMLGTSLGNPKAGLQSFQNLVCFCFAPNTEGLPDHLIFGRLWTSTFGSLLSNQSGVQPWRYDFGLNKHALDKMIPHAEPSSLNFPLLPDLFCHYVVNWNSQDMYKIIYFV